MFFFEIQIKLITYDSKDGNGLEKIDYFKNIKSSSNNTV